MTTVVVHLTASRFVGGPERQMLELAKTLPPQIRSVFVSFSETGLCRAFIDEARRDGFEALALRHDTPRLIAALRELIGNLRRLRVGVLCCHGYKSNLLGLLAARRLKIPAVSVSRGWTAESSRIRVYEALDRRVFRRMDKVVCVSEAQAQRVRCAGVAERKIVVIHNAICPERFKTSDPAHREQLQRLFVSSPTTIIGAAGRLSPEKGFDILVDAAAMVLQSLPSLGFVLFGDGPLRDALAHQITARGLEGRFVLAGFRSDLDRYFPGLDLFVQSSFTEGLPNVVLEACAAGVPVVATAVGGTPEIIEDGRTGYLCPPGDSTALAERILAAVSDPATRAAFATEGRERVARDFSFDSQADIYERLFHQLLAKLPQAQPAHAEVTATL